MSRVYFDSNTIGKKWNEITGVYSHRYDKHFTAWERLSHFYRKHYSRNYDGGVLRVIAFFGEEYPEYIDANTVAFQAGPATFSIGADPSLEPEYRYLLVRMAKIFREDEHLNRHIKGYFNAYHKEGSSRDSYESSCIRMFSQLHELLTEEIQRAEINNDLIEYNTLMSIATMAELLNRFN